MTLEEVTARQAIHDALVRYCMEIDRGVPALVESAFHPDGVDDHGPGRIGSATDLANGSAARKQAVLPLVGQHMITNEIVEFRGSGVAHCLSSWFVVDPGSDGYALVGGRFLDRFEQRDGDWRIAHRRVVGDWSGRSEHFEPVPKTEGLPHGRSAPTTPRTASSTRSALPRRPTELVPKEEP